MAKQSNVAMAMESALLNALTEFKTIVFNRLDEFEKRLVIAGQPVNRPAVPLPTPEDIANIKLASMKRDEKINLVHNTFKTLETKDFSGLAIDALCRFILLSDNKVFNVNVKADVKKLTCETCKRYDACMITDMSKCPFTKKSDIKHIKQVKADNKQAIVNPVTSDQKPLGKRELEYFTLKKQGADKATIMTVMNIKSSTYANYKANIEAKGYTV